MNTFCICSRGLWIPIVKFVQLDDPSYKNDYVGKEWTGKRQVVTNEGEVSCVGDDDKGTPYGETQMSGGTLG